MTTNEGVLDHEEGRARLSGGGELAYQIHGRANPGAPLLLIRPLGGTTALWGSFRDLLAERFRVISFDHRGAGASSPAPLLVTTPGLARDALGLLDRLGVERAHVFGISLGGMTATWLAILAPARVARLCIAAAPARGVDFSRNGLGRELSLAACVVRPEGKMEPSLVYRLLSRSFRESHPDEVYRLGQVLAAHPTSRASIVKHALAGALHDARGELSRIHAPTLVLVGGDDELLGTEPARDLASRIPGAAFEIVPDSGHDLTLEQPALVAARLATFFAGG